MQEETEQQVLERVVEDKKQIDLTLTIKGVYALPQEWKDLIGDEGQPPFEYEVCTMGMAVKGGKIIPRELTDKEKEEAEANSKTKGKAPPKGKKEEEITPEEQEKLDKEMEEKEEEDRRLKEEWDALDEDTKFYRTHEDPIKEPSIKFQIEVEDKEEPPAENEGEPKEETKEQEEQNEGEEESKAHLEDVSVTETKKSDALIELEEWIKSEEGWWIYFNKVLPKDDDEAADPKKKGKGKGAPIEDAKPIFGRAWLDLSNFKEPGETKISKKIFFDTSEPPKPKVEEGEGDQEPAPEANEEEEKVELVKVFEEPRTYIILDIEIDKPYIPTAEDFVIQALPHDLIKPKVAVKPQKDPEGDFRKQLTLGIESVNKEYLVMFEEDLRREGIGGWTDETFEARKEQFLYDFNTSGKYHTMKEKLKKSIVRIVRDTYNKKKSFKGLKMDDRDHFYSTMYSHLVNQIQLCLSGMVNKRKDILHENVLVRDKNLSEKEVEIMVNLKTKETEDEKLARLAQEYEELGDLDKAHNYIEERIKNNPDSIDLWRSYGLFMIRNYCDLAKAEECLRESINLCDENDDEIFLVYGALMVQMKEKEKALIFLKKVGQEEENPQSYIRAQLLMSLLYHNLEEEDLKAKHFSLASRMHLRGKGDLTQKNTLKETPPEPSTSDAQRILPTLNEEETDKLYMDLIESTLIHEGINELANDVIKLLSDEDSPKVTLIKAKILFGERKFKEALEIIEEYLDENKFDVEAIRLFADTYYELKNYAESEKAYLRAVRRGDKDPVIMKKLGLIYIGLKKWREALTVFTEYWNETDPKWAYAWRYLGMSGWKLRVIDGADTAFYFSNLLDNTNPETWGLLTIICLITGVAQNRAFQTYQKAIRLGLNNSEIFSELAFLLTKTERTHRDAEYWFEKALNLDPAQEDLWLKYAEFSEHKGDLMKTMTCYENALKYIKGEVKERETNDKLEVIRNKYDEEKKSLFVQMRNEAEESNKVAAHH